MANKAKRRLTPPDPNAAWAVRGIDPETRSAAKIAARRGGVTVGEFVSRAIRNEAKTAGQVPGPTNDQVLGKILELVEKQNARIEQLERRPGMLSRLFGRAA